VALLLSLGGTGFDSISVFRGVTSEVIIVKNFALFLKHMCVYRLSEFHSNFTQEITERYSSPSIVRVNKARRMRWAGHVARMGELRGTYNILVGRPE
jgi:hypothetical protein